MKKSLAALAAMAAAGTIGMGGQVSAQPGARVVVAGQAAGLGGLGQAMVKALRASNVASELAASGYGYGGRSYGSRGWQRRQGPGWTQAHVQRMARKKRNQARHRKASR